MDSRAPRSASKQARVIVNDHREQARSYTGAQQIRYRRIFCRSELARDGLKSTTFSQQARVIVNDHREQTRSYTCAQQICFQRIFL
ncbi:hypothetical protein AN403_5772 [Pseudomonas fluorescens]|uniref:Uncharacterized protein n=1 Tax=Pseudomonas fluorescens TaxID=294 RepID=A0A0P8ZW20_PSEFL|nr:hypothetical protein AN403_5772 [Pseudomonas fluorescens]